MFLRFNGVILTKESRMSRVLFELKMRIFYLGILRGHKLEIFQVFLHKIFIWTLLTWTLIWEFSNELRAVFDGILILSSRIIIQTISKRPVMDTICYYSLTSIIKYRKIQYHILVNCPERRSLDMERQTRMGTTLRFSRSWSSGLSAA